MGEDDELHIVYAYINEYCIIIYIINPRQNEPLNGYPTRLTPKSMVLRINTIEVHCLIAVPNYLITTELIPIQINNSLGITHYKIHTKIKHRRMNI